MENFEYVDEWDEDEDGDDEDEGWALSRAEIEERRRKVNQEKDQKIPKRSKRSKGQGLKLLLIRDFLFNEASREFPKDAADIQAFLEKEYSIKATTKTIYTDIKRLRKEAKVPIVYNAKRWGYYIDERPFSPAELRLMIDCVRNAEFITKEDAATLTEKIKGLASSPDKKLLAFQLEEENKKIQTEASVIENIPLLMKAIESRRKIRFRRYHYVAQRTTHTFLGSTMYTVSPHKLIRKSNRYILEYAEDWVDSPEAAHSFNKENTMQIHRKIDVSMLTDIEILASPSTYREMGSQSGQQTMDEALDWLLGKKRAITIRFRYDVIDRVLSRLGEDAILIDMDDYHFKTTIVERATPELFSWISDLGCAAKILGPHDIIEQFMRKVKMRQYDYELLYKQDLEPISILSDEELSALTDEQNRILMYDERKMFPPEYTDEGEK